MRFRLLPTSLFLQSENPPNIYFQSLTTGGAPVLLNPTSSNSAAVDIAFHPTRANIFLVTFRDGTITAYDATRVGRANGRNTSASTIKSGTSDPGAEIGSFQKLHTVTSSQFRPGPGAGRSTSITGATFIPATRCRALTVGSDGKCNIIDFDRSRVVKSWHVKGPATSVSVTQFEGKTAQTTTARARSTAIEPKPNASQTVIAIGRIDGKVLLYDTTGTLLAEKTVDDGAGRVIDVEWISGPSPQFTGDRSAADFKDVRNLNLELPSQKPMKTPAGTSRTHEASKDTVLRHTTDKADQALEKSLTATAESDEKNEADNLDESLFSTVKHNDMIAPVRFEFPNPSANAYMDLFSPINKKASPVHREPSPLRRTPSKPRPRILSSTFVQNPESTSSPPLTTARLTAPFQYETPLEGVPSFNFLKPHQVRAPQKGPSPKRRFSGQKKVLRKGDRVGSILNIPTSLLLSQSRDRLTPTSVSSGQSSANSRILADLRQLGDKEKKRDGKKAGDGLALLTPYYGPAVIQSGSHLTINGESKTLLKKKRASVGGVTKKKGRLSGEQ